MDKIPTFSVPYSVGEAALSHGLKLYTVYYVRFNLIPAQKDVYAESEQLAREIFTKDNIFKKILSVEQNKTTPPDKNPMG